MYLLNHPAVPVTSIAPVGLNPIALTEPLRISLYPLLLVVALLEILQFLLLLPLLVLLCWRLSCEGEAYCFVVLCLGHQALKVRQSYKYCTHREPQSLQWLPQLPTPLVVARKSITNSTRRCSCSTAASATTTATAATM
jgi:hypothetical protein